MPAMNQPTPTEQGDLAAVRTDHERCKCGEVHEHDDGVTPAVIARMRGYLAENPETRFAVDDEAGIVAVIIPRDPAPPEVLAWSADLIELLDLIGAPATPALSSRPVPQRSIRP